jgi:hypothetical protein
MWYPEGNERSLSGMFKHCIMEALRMHWLKKGPWKVGIALAGMALLLVLMIWVPMSAAGASEGASELATPATGTVQATPTEDATVTALTKEKLKLDADKDRSDLFWAWTASGTIVVGLAATIFSLFQFLRNRLDEKFEREKRDEERFQSIVAGLSDENIGTRTGAAIFLRTFLRPGYEKFY